MTRMKFAAACSLMVHLASRSAKGLAAKMSLRTGVDALARCNSDTFDVVFLDVNMPGLDGHATLVRLMQANPQAKVVMISSEHNALREREAIRLGAAAIMHKPFFPTEIDAVLHQIFGLQSPKLATGGCILDFGIKISWSNDCRRTCGNGAFVRIRLVPRATVPSPAVRPRKRVGNDTGHRSDGRRKKGGHARTGKCQSSPSGECRLASTRHAGGMRSNRPDWPGRSGGKLFSGKCKSDLIKKMAPPKRGQNNLAKDRFYFYQLQTRQHR